MDSKSCYDGEKCLSTVLAWILVMRDLQLEIPEVLVEPPPPLLSQSYLTDFGNVELAAIQETMLGVLCPYRFIQQPQPQLSDVEPRLSLSDLRISRNPGQAPASSSRPRHSCHVQPVLAPLGTLRHLLTLQPESNTLASTQVSHCVRFLLCPTTLPWRPQLPLTIGHPPWPFQRRNQSNPFSLGFPLSNAPLKYQGGAFWVILSQRMEMKPIWVQNLWSSKTAA